MGIFLAIRKAFMGDRDQNELLDFAAISGQDY
jgi:hypothetical protein